MEIRQCFLINNDCFKAGKHISPKGIVVHSTGANNVLISRYVQPDDGVLGKNKFANDWNRSGVSKCVHAFIGRDKFGKVRVYQTLPWDMRCWGCGKGSKGSYNDNYIQFEICEDALNNEQYFNECMSAAIELCKHLMALYNIPVSNVVSHHEAHVRGYASGHADCDHWLAKFGKDMNLFRSQLVAPVEEPVSDGSFRVKVTDSALNIRSGAGILHKVVGCITDKGVYTIVEVKGNWGKLKSGAGWISLKYTERL